MDTPKQGGAICAEAEAETESDKSACQKDIHKTEDYTSSKDNCRKNNRSHSRGKKNARWRFSIGEIDDGLITYDVPPLWKNGVAVCIGGGPSIKQNQIRAVAEAHEKGKCYAIAINNAYQIAPWADVVYGCDGIWWQWHENEVQYHQGLKLTISRNAALKYDWVTWIRGEATSNGLSKATDYVVNGEIGGYQAINLAVNFGATKILLMGYDMRNIKGASHWHGDHPNRQRPYFGTRIKHFKNMLPDLKERNIKVINCSPGSALDAFPMGNLEKEL